jgi:hypothetical protein
MNRDSRVESLLRSADAAPWVAAPAGLHERVMASLDTGVAVGGASGERPVWRYGAWALAASVAVLAGGLGVIAGAALWRSVPTGELLAGALPGESADPESLAAAGVAQQSERPAVVLARAFEDLRPAGSSRLVASVAAPMRSEAAGLAAETRQAAKTVLSRLPFVSMD